VHGAFGTFGRVCVEPTASNRILGIHNRAKFPSVIVYPRLNQVFPRIMAAAHKCTQVYDTQMHRYRDVKVHSCHI
jgi:hypothetical protein